MPADVFVALIPAAGVGTRAGGNLPKQYQPLLEEPMLLHTVRAFAQCARIVETLVVVSPSDVYVDEIHGLTASVVRCGGPTRAETVRNGLRELRRRYGEGTWVLVHDAARCCITPALIDALIDACVTHPVGGLLALPATDTLKRANARNESIETLERTTVWMAQTPQMFRLGALLAALEVADVASLTDEASAMERQGARPLLVPGSAANLKVTRPEDFVLAAALLRQRR